MGTKWFKFAAGASTAIFAGILIASTLSLLGEVILATTWEYGRDVVYDDPKALHGGTSPEGLTLVEFQPMGWFITRYSRVEQVPLEDQAARHVRWVWRDKHYSRDPPTFGRLIGHSMRRIEQVDPGVTFEIHDLFVPYMPILLLSTVLPCWQLGRWKTERRRRLHEGRTQ